jgi:hypothetical protein
MSGVLVREQWASSKFDRLCFFLDFDLEAVNRNDIISPYATKFLKLLRVDKQPAALRNVFFSTQLAQIAMAQQIPLTFGIELEFICIRPETLFHPEHEASYHGCEDTGAGPAIWQALLRNGVPAVGWEPLDADLNDSAPLFSRWRVETDSLHLSEEEERLLPTGYITEAVEISSRKLRFFTDDWRAELAAVLEVLRQVENRGCRFIANKSFGFHVHIGLDKGEFVPLRVVKNVFQLTSAFERQIDQLHGAARIELPQDHSERHVYYPLSFFHTYGDDFDPEKGTKSSLLLDRLHKIDLAKSYEDVGYFFDIVRPEIGIKDLVVSGHNSCVNFDNLYPDPEMERYAETLTGTIEFRQHAGTLDFLDIMAWATLTCKIVFFCGTATTSDFLDLIIRSVDPEFTLDRFLTEIDCPQDVYDHYRNNTIVGVIGQGSHLLGARIQLLVDALIEQNDHECEQRASENAVQAAIDMKHATGLYGIDLDVKVSLPRSIAASAFQEALAVAQTSGKDVNSEQAISRARAQVLGQFAELYRGGKGYFARKK